MRVQAAKFRLGPGWEKLEAMVSDQLKAMGLRHSEVPGHWRLRILFFSGTIVT